MSNHSARKRGRPIRSNRVWIQPEMNEDLDARKLSRAFLALALHRAAEEAVAEAEHDSASETVDGDGNERT
ncbi:MAG: hypothetical protein Q8S43_06370 [Actinomycetota bacterium]|nr:hypothetical protein [Actinomycetota bacterium]